MKYLTEMYFRFNRLQEAANPKPHILNHLSPGNRNSGRGGGNPIISLTTLYCTISVNPISRVMPAEVALTCSV